MSLPLTPLTPGVLAVLEDANRDILVTRYLSGEFTSHYTLKELYKQSPSPAFAAAGLVMLLYDHILTLPAEITLIWKSPLSFAKYAFLLNRYLVPLALIGIAFEMCGFSGFIFADDVSFSFHYDR